MRDGADQTGARPIIRVKRIRKVVVAHHGGAWKIAYADFATAMMAFFLLMWLLGSTAKADLKGISDYFRTPLSIALSGGPASGESARVAHVVAGGGEPAAVDLAAAEAERARREKDLLDSLKRSVETLIADDAKLAPYRNQLLLDVTSEGLRIQIVDDKNRPMFDSGSSQLKPYAKDILRVLATTLNGVDQRIGLSGHTDASAYPFGDKSYSNWELSADRANATRRELVAGGLADNRVIRVVGLGSAVPAKPESPLDAANRRVTIVVMNQETMRKIGRDGAGLWTGETEPPGDAEAGRTTPVRR